MLQYFAPIGLLPNIAVRGLLPAMEAHGVSKADDGGAEPAPGFCRLDVDSSPELGGPNVPPSRIHPVSPVTGKRLAAWPEAYARLGGEISEALRYRDRREHAALVEELRELVAGRMTPTL
ncbi:hypothetical protein ASD89_24095 [Caulobacter sp. Root656]|nr:hypothetical protein ASD89_24095 [Caulobacter sp. Root656]